MTLYDYLYALYWYFLVLAILLAVSGYDFGPVPPLGIW